MEMVETTKQEFEDNGGCDYSIAIYIIGSYIVNYLVITFVYPNKMGEMYWNGSTDKAWYWLISPMSILLSGLMMLYDYIIMPFIGLVSNLF